jgi:hypothetical protein
MRDGIVSLRRGVAVVFAIAALAGCGERRNPDQEAAVARADARVYPSASHRLVRHNALRVREDTRRHRVWVLSLDALRIYDTAATRPTLLREIILPDWSVAGYLCHPDMVLDDTGSALIASNVTPMLWHIDAERFEVQVRPLRLHGREQWDTGFRALAFAADGSLVAWTSRAESLWKIDAALGSARRIDIAAPPADTCAFPAQWLSTYNRSPQS